MGKLLLIVGVGIALAASDVGAQGSLRKTAPSNEGGARSDQVNEVQVREVYQRLAEAWNKHDVPTMAAMWAIDGDHLEPDGEMAKGREAVAKLFATRHQTVFKQSELKLLIDDVWFVTADVALVDGKYEVTGVRDLEGKSLPTRTGRLSAILLKEHGKWWIAASRLMIPERLPYKTES